jgi:hypothetical protein
MIEVSKALDELLLDPNNYRFQDAPRFKQVPESRFGEATVQASTLDRLDSEGLAELKASIQYNGFLAVEKVVVRPWAEDPSKSVVVEGNRRVAALKRLRDDHLAGIEINPDVLHIFDAVPLLAMDAGEPVDYLAIMGIRHVGGVRRWGPYQGAKLVSELRDLHGLEFPEIAQRLGLSTREVIRRHRAIKTLTQMEDDEEFGSVAKRDMYPLFHEAVAQPDVRSWLGWNDSEFRFENETNRNQFYEWLSPVENEDGEEPAKITTSAQVRVLKEILSSPEALTALRDSSRSFDQAQAITTAEKLVEHWPAELAEAVRALESIPVLSMKDMDQSRLALIEKLRDLSVSLLEAHAKLSS